MCTKVTVLTNMNHYVDASGVARYLLSFLFNDQIAALSVLRPVLEEFHFFSRVITDGENASEWH